jgi:hypothetical protein
MQPAVSKFSGGLASQSRLIRTSVPTMRIERLTQRQLGIGFALAAMLAAYGLIMWFVVETAFAIHKPCVSDFEGGCGYGKIWGGALSWLAAWVAIFLAFCLDALSPRIPSFKKIFGYLARLFVTLPSAYALYGVYQVAPAALELFLSTHF